MANTTQKIGAGILATAIISAIALTSATQASNSTTPQDTDHDCLTAPMTTDYNEFVSLLTKEGVPQEDIPTKAIFDKELELDKLYNSTNPDMKKIQALEAELYGLEGEEKFDIEAVTAFEKELNAMSDEELKSLEAEREAEDEFWKKVDTVISEDDWNTLSMKAIDDKLAAAGLEKIGDDSDPYYNTSVADMIQEFDTMSDEELKSLEAEFNKTQ